MLYGTVTDELKEGGGSASKDWAGRAELVDGGGGVEVKVLSGLFGEFLYWGGGRFCVEGE